MQPIPVLLLLAGGAALAAFPSADAAPQEPEAKPRILVVNDDGIDSPGLVALVKELSGFADVAVCAPDGNRSGASQSIAGFGRPLLVSEVEMEGARAARAIDGQPADATAYGLFADLLGESSATEGTGYALVVSGINGGSNLGSVSYYSGTVGAAREALMHGVPAVAVSAQRGADVQQAAAAAAGFIERLLLYGPDSGVVYNVNLPAGIGPETDWAATRMGEAEVRVVGLRDAQPVEDGLMVRLKLARPDTRDREGDLAAVLDEGKATVVPLRFDATDDTERARLMVLLAGRD